MAPPGPAWRSGPLAKAGATGLTFAGWDQGEDTLINLWDILNWPAHNGEGNLPKTTTQMPRVSPRGTVVQAGGWRFLPSTKVDGSPRCPV